MIQAIIFDCFGVLATDGWLPFKQKYFADDAAKHERATELNHLVDAGLIAYQDFVTEIAALAAVTPGEVDHMMKGAVPDERVFTYIRSALKSNYKIGLLSNIAEDWLRRMFSDEDIELFDARALSFETGFTKPAPEAYEIIAERIGVAPENCVFIDDQERNVTAAREQGMQGIWYQNYESGIAELEQLLNKA